jgi:hypothetical protein
MLDGPRSFMLKLRRLVGGGMESTAENDKQG